MFGLDAYLVQPEENKKSRPGLKKIGVKISEVLKLPWIRYI